MGDVIEVLDEVTIHRQCRHTGKKNIYEIVIMFPECLDKENKVITCESEEESLDILQDILNDVVRY